MIRIMPSSQNGVWGCIEISYLATRVTRVTISPCSLSTLQEENKKGNNQNQKGGRELELGGHEEEAANPRGKVKLPGISARERRMGTARGEEGEEWRWADETSQTAQLERHRVLLSPLFLGGTRNQQGLFGPSQPRGPAYSPDSLWPTSLPEPGPRKVRWSQHVRRDS